VDDSILVETLWWADGPTDLGPPHIDNEVGEGWLVVASDAALEQIREQSQTLWRTLMIRRDVRDEDVLLPGQIVRNFEQW
jgi:hypothetical protein